MADRMQRIDPRFLTVSGWIEDRIERTWKGNLLALDWDRDFLAPFLHPTATGGYVGLGKTLESLVRLAHHTRNPELLALRERVLVRLLSAQHADGYLGTMAAEARVEKLWDVHEMAYLVLALTVDARSFDHPPALEAARKIADYLLAHLSPGPYQRLTAGRSEPLCLLGLDRALLALYGETRDRRYLDFCTEVLGLDRWDLDIVEGRHGRIEGHIYAYLTRCLAQLELHDLTGQPGLLAQTRRVLAYLKSGGLVATGSAGQAECWCADQDGSGDLGETCATAYLIRLLDKRLRMDGHGGCGDWMERAVYNALFAAQSPDGRRLRYYTPFAGPRAFWEKDTYCCPGNFRRIVSELPEMMFYTFENGLAVNLYTPAALSVPLDPGPALRLRVETTYPTSGEIALELDPGAPSAFPLRLRIPAWCPAFSARVNGQPTDEPVRDGFLCLRRTWRPGDRVELHLDMDWRLLRGFGKQQGRVAVARGPLLYGLNPHRNPALSGQPLDALEIDPATLRLTADETLRPGGTACRLKTSGPASPDLLLTEFPDPGSEALYFQTPDPSASVKDELLDEPV